MKPAEHVRANVTDDGLTLLDIDKGQIYTANIVAARIWTMLMDNKSENEIVDIVAGEFGAQRVTVMYDTRAFIQSLHEKKLVVS